jgi:protein involved in polysaccharide export with SLBB domain
MIKKQLLRGIFLLVCLFMCSQVLLSQDLLKGKDLSQVKVDQLSDADIAKFKTQLNSSGLSMDQAEQMATAKGMSPTEFTKLKQRVAQSGSNAGQTTGKLKSQTEPRQGARTNNSPDSLDRAQYLEALKRKPLIDSLIFGSELYTSVAPSFEPNLNLATPLNYMLGPTDEISISVYGVQQYEGNHVVSPEGNISIPTVGIIKVAGLTIEEATQKIKTAMGNTVYPYLKSGASRLSITLSKIRTIRVTIIGSNLPGNYNLSSLATVFGALFLAGGPSAFGSFREIELLRNGKLERKIDLYRFLLNGDQSDNVGLKDNDVIRIPTYKKRVEIQGQVKRPGIFEVLPNEKFADILAFASGFTDTAYRADVRVFQRSDRERAVMDLVSGQYNNYEPHPGDVFVVSKLLNRFENRVKITGAVFRPDIYALTPGLKVADLIRKADGLREDAYMGHGQILRLKEDLGRSIVSFDIRKALANDPENNVLLQREDEVLVTSVQDLKDTFKVTIQGEVRMPGQYDYVANLTVADLILQAGGLTDAAHKKIEIARLIRRDSLAATDNRNSIVFNTEVSEDMSALVANIPLQPFDVVTIRRKTGYILPESVSVMDHVQYPGLYALESATERVSDILRKAGGVTRDAYIAGAYVKRYKTEEERQKSESISEKFSKNLEDTVGIGKVTKEIKRDFDQIPLDLETILKSPGSIEDLILRARDEIVIPKFNAQVRISGEVLMTTQVTYATSNKFMDYISGAGGYSSNALKNKSYIVYANGRAASTKHFLFFKSYPKVLPGSEIIVPNKPEKKGMSVAEIVGIASSLTSVAAIMVALFK